MVVSYDFCGSGEAKGVGDGFQGGQGQPIVFPADLITLSSLKYIDVNYILTSFIYLS